MSGAPAGSGPALLRVNDPGRLPAVLADAEPDGPRPVLVVIGSADGLSREEAARLLPLFASGVRPAVLRAGARVVDGGTDTGVMRMVGEIRDGAFPLIGVAPEGTVEATAEAGASGELARLEPHHSITVLVPGDRWGDESPWLAKVAAELAGDRPVVGLLVKGGDISEVDADHLLERGWPLVVVAGSGGVADRIAAVGLDGIVVAHVDEDPAALAATLEALLRGGDA